MIQYCGWENENFFTQFPIRFLWLKHLVIYKYFMLDYVALPFVLKEF